MWKSLLRCRALGAAALTLGLTASLCHAQLGTSPAERPAANRNVPVTGDVLPGVPATARDPAPPGTRAVRVDLPGDGRTAVGTSATRGLRIYTAEGVVTRIDRAGKNLAGELERFAFDPSQDWFAYTNRGAAGTSKSDADQPLSNAAIKDANVKQREDAPDKPKVMEMTITRQTHTYAVPRTADGVDLHGVRGSASGMTPPSFANLKAGSFVSVRYRKGGDVNEVLNLTLIDLPANPTTADRSGAIAPANTAKPAVRTPSIPLNPVGAALPK